MFTASFKEFFETLTHSSSKQFVIFLTCFAISFLIFFFRYPDAFTNPVFYAEDGTAYIGPILNHGFWYALFKARPDYIVFGNVALAGLAVWINQLIYPDNILHLPQVLAVVSYLFFAFVATLPILLFSNRINLSYLILLALATSFFPLHNSDFEVIGRALNIGYAFVYLAFLLVSYRNFYHQTLKLVTPVVDLGILICVSTNPVACLVVPLIYLPYLQKLIRNKHQWLLLFKNHLLRDISFISSVVLGLALAAQILVTSNGVSKVPEGHLDAPFVFKNTIEMILARSILYPIVYSFYKSLNDIVVVLLFIILVGLFIKFAQKKNYDLYLGGTYALFSFSILAAIFRPGLSTFFNSYTSTWPDRYFYGQNLISTFLIILLIHDLSAKFTNDKLLQKGLLAFTAAMFLSGIGSVSTYGHPTDSLRELGSLEQTLTQALQAKSFTNALGQPKANGEFVVVPIYPSLPPGLWKMTLPKRLVESSVAASQSKSLCSST